ncbi:hypothetical protein LCGC14_1290380 [marine sediment metagenome]|uniref:Uncharacterized protein n=1 Tax=marine sediment metagenome TaxID=412755 RepID=A0A0F9NVL8_9ZZZZ
MSLYLLEKDQMQIILKRENMQLIDLYSNILVLHVRMHKKELERRISLNKSLINP